MHELVACEHCGNRARVAGLCGICRKPVCADCASGPSCRVPGAISVPVGPGRINRREPEPAPIDWFIPWPDARPHRGYWLGARIHHGELSDLYHAIKLGVAGFRVEVAVRRLHASIASDELLARRLFVASRRSIELYHPGIIQHFELDVSNGEHYLVSELVCGVDLARVLRELKARGAALPVELALFLSIELCTALAYTHRPIERAEEPMGPAIHGVLGPRKVMLTHDGVPKITGWFGTAEVRLGRGGARDPDEASWIAPDVLGGEAPSPQSDLYSVGALLLRLLGVDLAAHPYRGARSGLFQELPAGLLTILVRAMAREPADRFASAEELGRALTTTANAVGRRSGAADLAAYLARHHQVGDPTSG